MTSEYNVLNRQRQSDGRDGRSPISELKLVKYDAFVDSDLIDDAMDSAGKSFIKGPLQQEFFSIMKYDLLLTRKHTKQWRSAQVGEETTLRVIGTINGLGGPRETRMELLNQFRCAGFAGTGTREDSTGQAPKRDLPVVLGGLYNAWNTGDQVITQGDWVYWDFPENHEEIRKIQGGKYNQGRPNERYLPLLRPYDPEKQNMNVEMLRYFNVDSAIHSNHGDFHSDFSEWSLKYAESARGLMYLGAMMAISGLFGEFGTDGVVELTDDELITHMKNRLDANEAFATDVAEKLGLGLAEKKRPQDDNEKGSSIKRVANRLIFPKHNRDRLVAHTYHENQELKGIKKITARIQSSAIKTNLKSGEEVRQFVKSRIVGKAMESVGPGDFFDISIGSYAI